MYCFFVRIGFFPNFGEILKHLLMYLNVFEKDLVLSAAVQILKSGRVVAHVYYGGTPRSYEDCVRYGLPHDYSSLSDLINHYVAVYGKVFISYHS